MTEHIRPNSQPEGLEFERQDLSPGAVYAFLIGLALTGVAVYFVLWGVYYFANQYWTTHQPPARAMQPAITATHTTAGEAREVYKSDIQQFPDPRLERAERTEINNFRLEEEKRLNSYNWADEKAGTVEIPIERAMEIIAQKGLNTAPKTGTVPASVVNTIYDAAARADHSNLGSQGQKISEEKGKGTKK